MIEKKRFVRIMKGVPEFTYMDEQTAKMTGTKGGWILSPEPEKIEKEVWTPQEEEPEEMEIDTTIRAEEPKTIGIENSFGWGYEAAEKAKKFMETTSITDPLPQAIFKELNKSELTETPVVKRGRKPKN